MELPVCNAPFTIGPKGTDVVEANSEDATASHVYNVAVCPQGFRDDLPEYGIPPLVWQTMPLDLTAMEEAIHRWEPECDLSATQQRTAVGEAAITLEVS